MISDALICLPIVNALTNEKNANMIKNVARTKNIGLNLKPEILIQPAASGKHDAKVLETP